MNNFNKGILLDFSYAAASIVSGAISGVTPKVSAWMKVKGVDSVVFTLTTTSTAAGSWSCEVSNDEGTTKVGIDRATLANPPTTPTGTSQNSAATIYMLGYSYFRLTFTPSGGAGNADAAVGAIQGRPVDLAQITWMSGFLYIPAADNLTGTWLLEVSNDWSGMLGGRSPVPTDGLWGDAVVSGDPAITNPAGSGQSQPVRLTNLVGFGGIRLKYTPTTGFGSAKATFVGKAA